VTPLADHQCAPSSIVYFPVITWTTADVQPMETEDRVARGFHRNPPLGTPLMVFHDSADPSHWTLASTGTHMHWLVGATRGVFALFGRSPDGHGIWWIFVGEVRVGYE
jgi:hypothetical protein